MNIRQSANLFDLIRRTKPERVVEIGRHWGGSTVLIAAAVGDFDKFGLRVRMGGRWRAMTRPLIRSVTSPERPT